MSSHIQGEVMASAGGRGVQGRDCTGSCPGEAGTTGGLCWELNHQILTSDEEQRCASVKMVATAVHVQPCTYRTQGLVSQSRFGENPELFGAEMREA